MSVPKMWFSVYPLRGGRLRKVAIRRVFKRGAKRPSFLFLPLSFQERGSGGEVR